MAYTDNADNSVQTFESGLMYDFTFKSGLRGVAMLNHQYENVTDTFNLSDDVYIPSGKYGFNQFETHLNSPQSNPFVLGVDFTGGSFYGGSRLSFGFEPLWNIGSTLQLGLKYEYNILQFKNRNQSFKEGVAGFKALVMLTTKLSASVFVQYNGAEDAVITNFRLRFNPSEGNDFYIVLNEGRNTFRDIEDPRLPVYNNRSILLK
jgi:hypothetical protein